MTAPPSPLIYLSFDPSLDTDGVHTFDAVASTSAGQQAAVMAEVERVLAWASTHFADGPGPLDEGGSWFHDLQCTQEDGGWYTVSLSVSGTPAFGEAFSAAFAGAIGQGLD
ncbi:MAG: hypothetical protein I8H76_12205 [Burkholderiales bacterium]|nr:hypothetical protein [Burkholderiales bacterium]MBH2016085.1 hypothetical protein [Burkholderiales bacterium]